MKKSYITITLTLILLVSCWQKTWQEDNNSDNNLQVQDEGYIEPGTSGIFLSDPSTVVEDGVSDENESVSQENPFNL